MANPSALAFSYFGEKVLSRYHRKVDVVEDLEELLKTSYSSEHVGCLSRIGNTGAKDLAKILKSNKTVKFLFLKWSGINDKGAKHLAKVFHSNETLQVLHIIESNIQTAADFANSLKASSISLKVLNLEGNKLGDLGAENIANALKDNKSLVALCLAKNQISKVGAQHIADALQVNQTLQNLDLRSNHLTDFGCKHLAKALSMESNPNTSLIILCLNSNDIGNPGAAYLADALKLNKSLTSLSIHGGPDTVIESFGANKLVEGLALNFTLTELNYKTLNLIPPDIDVKIQKLLRRNSNKKTNEFLETLRSDQKIPWNRSRLMFVGQGCAGKSATVRSLLGQTFNPNWDSTVGAMVSDGEISTSPTWGAVSDVKIDHASTFAARIMNQEATRRRMKDVITSEVRENGSKILSYAKNMKRRISRNRDSRNRARKILVDIEDEGNDESRVENSRPQFYENEIVREYDERLIVNAGADSMNLSLWDFGGQTVFYSMHHIFLTKTGVYILAFDMREFMSSQTKAVKYLSFWLNSIKLHAPAAPVVVVGTFLSDIDNVKDIRFINVELDEVIKTITAQVVTNEGEDLIIFPIDNKTGEGVDALRMKIEQVVRADPVVDQEVSMKWILLLDEILSKRKSSSYLLLKDVQRIAKDVEISTHKEFELALSLLHDRGMLIHLTATEILKNIVIINPQWLIDSLTKVIRDDILHRFNEGEFARVGLKEDLKRLFEYGLASRDILEYVWDQEQVDFLLDLMERTLLLSKW
eukprot:CAMPEP_0204875770 /NCGR_PEP_ID=MMETSP1348-20121228/46820_1 /ASSEMBLY_ACC=CAM_ASM_000700 /TAXON_ID=215587 /ORGANISM="Aplanochytrium stocchinoi, Strain GSBS06" /LENGTH=757 /DNA_ID=CAMNT_0052032375 /DNA_START=59 /DNA_END=2329 /DNA_ORIENTATION=-